MGDWIQMGRLRKWLRRVPIPAAFIICGLSCLLAALALTKLTVWFAQKNMSEIAEEHEMQFIPVGAAYLDMQLNPAGIEYQDMDWVTRLEQDPERLMEDPLQEQDSSQIQDSSQNQDSSQAQDFSQEQDSTQDQNATVINIEPAHFYRNLHSQVVYYEGSRNAGEDRNDPELGVYVMNIGTVKEEDRTKYDFFAGLNGIAAVLWYSVCLCLAALVFYQWKLKKPFRALNQAVQKISENDLNYQLEYDGQDEFGRLCRAFERMRQELVCNNQKMWDSVEERKRLNAAFAHDLRTPITILQGHTDMLLDALEEDDVSGREFKGSVHAISQQVRRMNAYVDTMGTLQRLEDYEPCPRPIQSSALKELVSETAALLFPKGRVEIQSDLKEMELLLDKEAFAQICENLVSNAARYAREKISVSLHQEQETLLLTVEDDGVGFSRKDLVNATLAYYRGDKTEAGAMTHFGLGLYICGLLAGKMGGDLSLENAPGGGARVKVKLRYYSREQ